jgi:hypothetical protein
MDSLNAIRDKDKIILHLCADIGSDTKKYVDAGYDVRLIGKKIGVENFSLKKGTLDYVGNVYGIIANPVCTDFSIATGFDKKRDYGKGMFLVNHCLRIIEEAGKDSLAFWVIENPATGHLKDFLGKPQYVYEPWWYGDPWTKKTALWGKFNIPPRKYFKWEDVKGQIPTKSRLSSELGLYIRPGRTKPSMAFLHKSAKKYIPEFNCFNVNNDMEFRSLCPQKFAMEFFAFNR